MHTAICTFHFHPGRRRRPARAKTPRSPGSNLEKSDDRLRIDADTGDMVPHDAADLQVLEGKPDLVHLMREHACLQPVLAGIHPAPPTHISAQAGAQFACNASSLVQNVNTAERPATCASLAAPTTVTLAAPQK